jgi:hypothetical protein
VKTIVLICLLFCGVVSAAPVPISFTIEKDSSRSAISTTMISTMSEPNDPWMSVADMDVFNAHDNFGLWESRSVIRFEKLIDSLRMMIAAHPSIVIDSGKIVLTIENYGTALDSVKMGIIRLASGQGSASRHFERGNGQYLANPDSGGVTWNMCVDKYLSPWLTDLAWSAAGAKGAGDTVGGMIGETPWLTVADSTGDKVTWKLTGASIVAAFDSSTSAKDTTAARYPGWLLYITDAIDSDTSIGKTFCTGYYGVANYCNYSGCEPTLTVYMTYMEPATVGRTGNNAMNIGRNTGGTLTIGR